MRFAWLVAVRGNRRLFYLQSQELYYFKSWLAGEPSEESSAWSTVSGSEKKRKKEKDFAFSVEICSFSLRIFLFCSCSASMHVRCVQHDIRALSSGKKNLCMFFYELLLPIALLFILA